MAQPPPSPTAQQQQAFSQPEPEPPNVKFIECVCASADSRADDNSSWTNIIREPIEITKGSELKIQTNFIDMRGIDGEIIEFQLDGRTQDNSHTLLTQLYSCNDGCNSKTTSYDYIGSRDYPETVDPGENYVKNVDLTTNATNWSTDGDGTQFTGGATDGIVMKSYEHTVRPKNISIAQGGSNYTNGSSFKCLAQTSTDEFYTGVIMTDSAGVVKQVIMTIPVAASGPPTLVNSATYWEIEFDEAQRGTGLQIVSVNTADGLLFSSIYGEHTSAGRGIGFKPGDSLYITQDTAGNAVALENQAQIKLSQVYMGPGAIMWRLPHFDQGYNYEKSPVLRWDQSFDMTTKFSYGENTGTRTVQTHGTTVSVTQENTHQTNDPCLSSGKLITSKEDPFAPGIFHTDPQDREFKINAPVLYFSSDNTFPFTFKAHSEGGWDLSCPTSTTTTINGNVVDVSPLNSIPLGSIYLFQFSLDYTLGTFNLPIMKLLSDYQNKYSSPMRVQKVFQENGRTVVRFNNRLIPYVGVANAIETTNFSPPGTFATGTGGGTHGFPLNYVGSEDGGLGPTGTVEVLLTYNDAGQTTKLEVSDGGKGCRVGQYFNITGTPFSPTETVYITQVDSTAGWSMPVPRDAILQNSNLTVDDEGTVKKIDLHLVPIMSFSDWDASLTDQGNSIMYREERTAPEISVYPPTLAGGILQTSFLSFDDGIYGNTKEISNGIYRPSGQGDPRDPYFDPTLGSLTNHDTNTLFNVTDSGTDFLTIDSVAFSGTGLIKPFGTGTDPWYRDPDSDRNILRIDLTIWTGTHGRSYADLPTNTYIVITNTGVGDVTNECHIQTGGLLDYDVGVGGFASIEIICPDVHSGLSLTTGKILNTAAATFMGQSTFPATGSAANNLNEWGLTDVKLFWVNDYKRHNTQIKCKWNSMTGSVAVTGTQNFFGNNDVNKSIMIDQPLYKNPSSAMISTYDKGGYYFLTHMTGSLATKEKTSFQHPVNTTIENFFNLGLNYWNTALLPNVMYRWRTDYQVTNEYNYQQSMCSIGGLWDYYNLYKQKTFIINKPFCVASDISGLWTRQAHALGGAINPTNNVEYVEAAQTGIIQNEFIMPVYGSNNRIGLDGKYEPLDKVGDVYEHTGGLEPGHCVGKNYVNDDCNWLSGSLMAQLPIDNNNDSFYFIFFRSAFTRYRGYDPLASDSTDNGKPDFTPLKTVGLQAHSIGNSNKPKALNGPAEPPIKKYLDGTDTLLSYWPPDTGSAVNTDEDVDTFAYELGPAAGVAGNHAPVPPADPSNGPPTTFGQRGYYPIFYLDRAKAAQYDKAKISQYVGSQNLALAFATDISTFTFQFLHSPFTAPFVDGEGGQIAARVFFGNRRGGVYNHEVFGGVVVANYARPDFPLNTFTETEIKNNTAFPEFPNGIDPLKSVGRVGLNFMNKIGFTDADVGVKNGKLVTGSTELGYIATPYTIDITALTDGLSPRQFSSKNTKWYGTTGSDIDTSDAILTQIPPPEENPGIESNNQEVIPLVGQSNTILRKFGDYIFYPYSYSSDSSSFKDSSIVRFDNASSTYGAVGGMLMSNSNRGMGLPNTLGSTFLTDATSVPRTLNPDCELYLAYTIECSSSLKKASLMPVKLNNGYLMILSSLMRETNLYMPNAGFVNAMSIVNFTFLQGDYILSQGEMSFYAKEDFILSEITTSIRDTNFGTPSSLGKNSSVIYSITDFNPKPKMEMPVMSQIQDQDFEIMRMVQSHQSYLQGQSTTSALQELHSDLYSLGINTLEHKNDVDIIGAIRNQINTHDIANLTANERTQFLRTAEGENFLQNVHDAQVIHQQVGVMADARNDMIGEFGGLLGQQRQEKVTRDAEREISIRERSIRGRTPLVYFQPNDPIEVPETPPPPDRRRNVNRFIEFRTTKHQDLLGKVFYSKDQRNTADATMTGFADRVKAITAGKRGRPTREQSTKIVEIGAERTEYLKSLRDKMDTRLDVVPRSRSAEKEERTPTERGIGAIRRGGYTPDDIDAMERFQARMREEERLGDIRQQIQQASVVSPNPALAPKTGGDDSGVGTMAATRRGSGY